MSSDSIVNTESRISRYAYGRINTLKFKSVCLRRMFDLCSALLKTAGFADSLQVSGVCSVKSDHMDNDQTQLKAVMTRPLILIDNKKKNNSCQHLTANKTHISSLKGHGKTH